MQFSSIKIFKFFLIFCLENLQEKTIYWLEVKRFTSTSGCCLAGLDGVLNNRVNRTLLMNSGGLCYDNIKLKPFIPS